MRRWRVDWAHVWVIVMGVIVGIGLGISCAAWVLIGAFPARP